MDVGFIILRHVNNSNTNNYWIKCYDSIRHFYPDNYILIIDDNSDYTFVTDKLLTNTTIIQSEYPKRGELLPYYYFLRNKLFDTAVILHDSVFIQTKFNTSINKYKLLWEFEHNSDQILDETKMITAFEDEELLYFYNNKSLWKGCFGGMTIITHDFLTHVNSKYDFNKLLNLVLNRYNRCSFERVLACLLQKEHTKETLFGNIHMYCKWGIPFKDANNYPNLPVVKVWTSR
uniref:Glycosyltransferase 2-like domain-containing protein n=1 Tax=viral metagenome TaxID=1070528 RepID=A0A6C0ENY9_9ZZZZ